ncbi:transposase [Corynebacterium canis]|uniref:Transposase n=1 Tax=Corynebacterium canis TaxID=679663 RepID=A0A5C5UI40_9CORY|nr:transposase [Corynebacterium canis]
MPRSSARTYSKTFRAAAIARVIQAGRPRTEVAQELDIPLSTLNYWVSREIGTLGSGSGSHNKL